MFQFIHNQRYNMHKLAVQSDDLRRVSQRAPALVALDGALPGCGAGRRVDGGRVGARLPGAAGGGRVGARLPGAAGGGRALDWTRTNADSGQAAIIAAYMSG